MANNFPSIGEYNQVIQKKGGSAFRTLNGISLIPSKISPIKVYLFGSGAFAAVFKGRMDGKNYAIRCFLSSEIETINRYKLICDYLRNINSDWKTDCDFIDKEIYLNDNYYPILKMDWMDGSLINQFVTQNLSDNNVLNSLQIKLVEVANDLERNKIGHGDIQCGNIIITGPASNFKVKLIDYDGMYIPILSSKKSIERGRSEFQHPKRTLSDFSSEIDRFSFWVILTALEALKFDKSLWLEVMQGGFNSLDNFLFTIHDFTNPNQSVLFNRLHGLNKTSLNFYLETLKWLCNSELSVIPIPALYNPNSLQKPDKTLLEKNSYPNKFKIVTKNCTASVLTINFKKIGTTPLELDKQMYNNKVIIVSNGSVTKQVTLYSHLDIIEITL